MTGHAFMHSGSVPYYVTITERQNVLSFTIVSFKKLEEDKAKIPAQNTDMTV